MYLPSLCHSAVSFVSCTTAPLLSPFTDGLLQCLHIHLFLLPLYPSLSFSSSSTSFMPSLLRPQFNVTALDWSQLSKKECLKYGGTLLGKSCKYVPDLALMSFILFFGTYSMTVSLKKFKFSRYFPTKVGPGAWPNSEIPLLIIVVSVVRTAKWLPFF